MESLSRAAGISRYTVSWSKDRFSRSICRTHIRIFAVEELASIEMCVGDDETILLVEDDESVRKRCKHSLEQCCYTIPDSEGAMKAFQELSGNIDLILTMSLCPI